MEGRTLSHFRILDKIGAGGMGVVYRARDTHLDRDVAIKVLPSGALTDADARRRFRKEALALSRLNHPNIATVHDFDTRDGIDFLVLEFIPGTTLGDMLAGGPLDEPEIARLGAQLAEGLAASHQEGVLHRDLKPGNLRVTPDGRLKILDFGLAKHLRPAGAGPMDETLSLTGAAVGTVPYMAPEQLLDRTVDRRTDLYAAGAVLYEMATGRRPFPQTGAATLINAILNDVPPPPRGLNPRLSEHLEAVILRALQKHPRDRHQSAADLRLDLQGITRPAPRPITRRRRFPRRRIVAMGAALGALALAGLGAFRLLAPARASPSLAVLPFANDSADPEAEYLSDGITESIINTISQLPRVKVIGRTSVFRYKGAPIDPKRVGRELGVRSAVVGRVARLGDDLVVGVELVDTRDGHQVWGQQYRRRFTDIFQVQEDIADNVVANLRHRLSGREQALLARRPTGNPEAYQHYLRGRYFLNKYVHASDKAMEYLRRAIDLDPAFALAHVGLAEGYWNMSSVTVSPEEARPKVKAAIARALEIDPELAEAHVMAGTIASMLDWDWPAAERAYRKALALQPGSAHVHQHYGVFLLLAHHRHHEAAVELERARELDPLSPAVLLTSLWPSYYAPTETRDYKRLEGEIPRLLELDPENASAMTLWGFVHLLSGQPDAAIEKFSRAAALMEQAPFFLCALGHAYALKGDAPKARELLEGLLRRSDRGEFVNPSGIAEVYAGLDDRENMYRWLERGYRERDEALLLTLIDPRFDRYRADARFEELTRRVLAGSKGA